MTRTSRLLLLAAGLCLAACESPAKRPPPPATEGESNAARAYERTRAGIGEAAMSPLADLNVRREDIPDRLEALTSPYEPVKARDCVSIGVEVLELTNILGPDSDAPAPGASGDGRYGDAAADMALRQVSSTMSDFIPFRSLVRTATGANAWAQKVRDAYQRGLQRRAFLKGVGASLGCSPPAAPIPGAGVTQPAASIEYRTTPQRPPAPKPQVTLPPSP